MGLALGASLADTSSPGRLDALLFLLRLSFPAPLLSSVLFCLPSLFSPLPLLGPQACFLGHNPKAFLEPNSVDSRAMCLDTTHKNHFTGFYQTIIIGGLFFLELPAPVITPLNLQVC